MSDTPTVPVPLACGSPPAETGNFMPRELGASAYQERREAYSFLTKVPLRWSDFDMMGHVNNVQYMRCFEVVAIDFFNACDVFPQGGSVTIFAAENLCRFLKPLNYPLRAVDGGLRVEHMGKSSLRFGFALFRQGDSEPSAVGYWVQVFIDRATHRSTPMPDKSRAALARYLMPGKWTFPGA